MLPLLWLTACSPDHEILPQRRELSTELATFDAGAVAVGDRETLPIFLRSTGRGPITIFDISTDDETHFKVLDSWKTNDSDGDGVLDSQIVPEGDPYDPSYGLVEVNFRPDAEDYFRAILTITSNDSEVVERDEEGRGLWKVVVRGIGRYPCAHIQPLFQDFGERAAGGYYSESIEVENCGAVTLTISDFDVAGSTSFYVPDSTPIYVLPSTRSTFQIAWIPASASPEAATFSVGINDPDFDSELLAIGNDCTGSVSDDWDEDGDGWFSCGGDCDDDDPGVHPGTPERAGNGVDDDCDGEVDEDAALASVDDDGDGFSENQGDCDDANPDAWPGAEEQINQLDDDCDGKVDNQTDWFDDDGDGFSEREGDCDDSAPLVYPGATESVNQIDDDCDGKTDEGSYTFDDDGDGYADYVDDVEVDCDDDDPWTYPGAIEDCDDRDNDCDGRIDEAEDNTEDGACAFIVSRSIAPPPPEGCTALPRRTAPSALLLGLLAAALGRRQRSQRHA